ncbi:MAG: hypothetical protein ACKVQQ_15740 [Burkholderiales bacterium]
MSLRPFLVCLAWPLLSGCEQIAELDGTKARNADAIAVGSACRHAGRALEDCYSMNPDAAKAQVFAGWKEMNDYMTSNKIEVVPPALAKAAAPKPADKDKPGSAADKPGRGEKTEKVEKVENPGRPDARADTTQVKGSGLPTTSAAAADPLIGLKAGAPAAAAGGAEKAPGKPAVEGRAGK